MLEGQKLAITLLSLLLLVVSPSYEGRNTCTYIVHTLTTFHYWYTYCGFCFLQGWKMLSIIRPSDFHYLRITTLESKCFIWIPVQHIPFAVLITTSYSCRTRIAFFFTRWNINMSNQVPSNKIPIYHWIFELDLLTYIIQQYFKNKWNIHVLFVFIPGAPGNPNFSPKFTAES